MCNLYRMRKATSEVAHLFDVVVGNVGNAGSGDVYPCHTQVCCDDRQLQLHRVLKRFVLGDLANDLNSSTARACVVE